MGAVSYLSDCYGGRATDLFMVHDCGFLKYLQPRDQVMADRGFKIKDTLAFHQCTLAIPPSKHNNLQMSKEDVAKTSKIANVRIYVEQAIGRMKQFHILKHELPISLLPMIDDITVVCAVMSSLYAAFVFRVKTVLIKLYISKHFATFIIVIDLP